MLEYYTCFIWSFDRKQWCSHRRQSCRILTCSHKLDFPRHTRLVRLCIAYATATQGARYSVLSLNFRLVGSCNMASSSKSQQERIDSAPPSHSGSVSKGRNKSRKSREHKRKRDAEAGLSNANDVEPVAEAGPSTIKDAPGPDVANTTFGQEDFIAFTFSDDAKEDDDVAQDEESQEGDKGKGKARDYEGPGRKRKHDEIDDRRESRRRPVDVAALKRAPWAAGVDWDRCNNVAEMCVACVPCMLYRVYHAHSDS